MEQIYDLPDYSRRSQLRQIFTAKCSFQDSDFVPFNSERDKLGKLIGSHQSNQSCFSKSNKSGGLLPKRFSLPIELPAEKTQNAEKTIGRIFKQNGVRGSRSTSDFNKMSIGSVLSEKRRQNPPQDFEVGSIQDRLKYTKAKQAVIKPPSRKKEKTPQHPRLIEQRVVLKQVDSQESECRERGAPSRLRKTVQLNMDLPQLQRYNRMKKLKTKVVQNFQQNHVRFKDLARKGLILANNIKRGLELD